MFSSSGCYLKSSLFVPSFLKQTSLPLLYPVSFLRAKLKTFKLLSPRIYTTGYKRKCPPPTPAANPPTPSARAAPSSETPSRQERPFLNSVVSLVTRRPSLRTPRTRSLRATPCIGWKRLRRRSIKNNL